jgi:uncharacterized protein YeaO (DUF488 family)
MKGTYNMKELIEGAILNSKELSEWFGINPNSFSRMKKIKLEELRDFCDYELIETETGRFKEIHITTVYNPVYSHKMNPLKKQFLTWIKNGGIGEVASQTPDNVYSYPVVINYFCKKNNIPYDGAHYLIYIEDGKNAEGNKIHQGTRRVTNDEYPEWHYLYRLLKKYQMDNKIRCGYSIDCCAKGFNPTKLRSETEKDQELQNKIYQKYFGELSYEDICELVDQVTAMVEQDEITIADKNRVVENRVMRSLSSKQKRQMAAEECSDIGVLRRKGYSYDSCGNLVSEIV